MMILALSAALAARPVEFATADDCAIVVAIGKAQAGWDAHGPNLPFVTEAEGAHGVVYRQDCPWRRLGVGAPKIASRDSNVMRFGIERPAYTADGREARADFNVVGPRTGGPAFALVTHCRLRREQGRWRLLECVRGPIT